MKPEKITAELLIEKGAPPGCDEVIEFRSEWPDGAEVTLENLNRAAELGLPIERFAGYFLSGPAKEAFAETIVPACKARKTAVDIAWEAYMKATAPALEAYQKAIAPALYKAWQSME